MNAARTNQAIPNYTERYHYSTVPLHFGEGNDIEAVIADGINKLGKRSLKKWSEVKAANDRLASVLAHKPEPTAADVGGTPLEVPYMFCTDDHVGAVLSCARFDRGPDFYEVARTKIENYWNNYFFTHFKRDRLEFWSGSAFNGALGTFYDLQGIYKHWVNAFYGRTNPDQQQLTRFKYDPLVQDTWSMAVFDSANAHLSVFSVPPAGYFMFRNFGNGRTQWDLLSEGDDFDQLTTEGQEVLRSYYSDTNRFNPPASGFAGLRRGQARRMYSRFDFKSGFGFWNRMLEVGHYNDQMGAMFATAYSQAQFLGADGYADQNRYAIPYYLVFKQEFGDTFGALWSNNEDIVRPTMFLTKDDANGVTQVPQLAFRTVIEGKNYIQQFNYPKRTDLPCQGGATKDCLETKQLGGPANIQLTWTSRIYALYLGMAGFSVNFDLDYAKQNQVFKLGAAEEIAIAPGYHAVEVPDVTNGSRYVAVEKDGATGQPTPGVRMIAIANAYRQVVENPTICPMPVIPNAFGPGSSVGDCMPTDETKNPVLVEQRRREYTEYFKDQIRDLDLMRGFYNVFGRAF